MLGQWTQLAALEGHLSVLNNLIFYNFRLYSTIFLRNIYMNWIFLYSKELYQESEKKYKVYKKFVKKITFYGVLCEVIQQVVTVVCKHGGSCHTLKVSTCSGLSRTSSSGRENHYVGQPSSCALTLLASPRPTCSSWDHRCCSCFWLQAVVQAWW